MRRIIGTVALLHAFAAASMWQSTSAGAEDSTITGNNVEISPETERPATPGSAETFTGQVSVQPLFDPNAVRQFSSAEVAFSPGARTAWHTHPAGQTLIVTSGTGWVQDWDGEKRQLAPGDVVWTPPNVKHWHGAVEDAAMSHIAIQGIVDGSPVEWLEHVTEQQYLG